MLQTEVILNQYGLLNNSSHDTSLRVVEVITLTAGLIHTTWKIVLSNQVSYILQRVNTNVFKKPNELCENIFAISQYLYQIEPSYKCVAPIHCKDGKGFISEIKNEDNTIEYFRMFPYIEDSFVYQTVSSSELAYAAAAQFAKLSLLLDQFDLSKLHITLENFHNLSIRYDYFIESIEMAKSDSNLIIRSEQCQESIEYLIHLKERIVDQYHTIIQSQEFKLRVMHHDTKISNVLFDKNGNGLCLIDLDTIMPGYFISDVGDMIRTFVCPVDENHANFNDIEIRDDYFIAIVKGYMSEMGTHLTSKEKTCFVYAGLFMIYMQAIRFLSDYLRGDCYYPIEYPTHNYVRAGNQITLLKALIAKENILISRLKSENIL